MTSGTRPIQDQASQYPREKWEGHKSLNLPPSGAIDSHCSLRYQALGRFKVLVDAPCMYGQHYRKLREEHGRIQRSWRGGGGMYMVEIYCIHVWTFKRINENIILKSRNICNRGDSRWDRIMTKLKEAFGMRIWKGMLKLAVLKEGQKIEYEIYCVNQMFKTHTYHMRGRVCTKQL